MHDHHVCVPPKKGVRLADVRQGLTGHEALSQAVPLTNQIRSSKRDRESSESALHPENRVAHCGRIILELREILNGHERREIGGPST
jgi:hypothetical protein